MGNQSYQNQGFVPRDGQRKFYSREEEVNGNQNSHVTPTFSIIPTPTFSIILKPKTSDLLNSNDYQKFHPFIKTLLKETR